MFCPECGGEYRQGFYECSDCGVPLVDESPSGPSLEAPGEPAPKRNLVTVFEIENASIMQVAESLLENANLAYAFKTGRRGSGFLAAAGAMEIQVEEEREAEARILLSQLGTRD